MTRWTTLSFAVLVAAVAPLIAAELPTRDADESFEIEPPLLIKERPVESSPASILAAKSDEPANPERLEIDLERAKRRAVGAERLCKIGALAKIEVEQRKLRVARLQAELENARLLRVREELQAKTDRVTAGEISAAELESALAAVAHATDLAHEADANRQRAELEAAESNLHRQQKLLALGSARRSDVNRAEQKLAELKTPKD